MDKVTREKIGPFVVTYAEGRDLNIVCARCENLLAKYNEDSGDFSPSCQEVFASGAVPIPNFGWFCGQSCADSYGREFDVRFKRNTNGLVEYYPNGLS